LRKASPGNRAGRKLFAIVLATIRWIEKKVFPAKSIERGVGPAGE